MPSFFFIDFGMLWTRQALADHDNRFFLDWTRKRMGRLEEMQVAGKGEALEPVRRAESFWKLKAGESGLAPQCRRDMIMKIQIKQDDLTGPEIAELLREHLRSLFEVTPVKSRHALNLDQLRRPEITFWSAWIGGELAGCAALKELDAEHGEVKSMRTAKAHLRKGIASALLRHIISEAKRRGYRRLSLETGAMPYFKPAHALYRSFGFTECAPFGDYREDANSIFMTKLCAEAF